MKELQAYEGPKSELAPPEQFLLAMSTVPRLTDKLNILILMQQFEAHFPCLLAKHICVIETLEAQNAGCTHQKASLIGSADCR